MTCSGCTTKIKRALGTLEGVEESNVDIQTGEVNVKGKFSLSVVMETLTKAGFYPTNSTYMQSD